jgi:hypothetical protein
MFQLKLSDLLERFHGLHQGLDILGEDLMLVLHFPLQLHLVEDHICLGLEFTL